MPGIPDSSAAKTDAPAASATDPGRGEKRYIEIRVSDVEVAADREDSEGRAREAAGEAQRRALRPVVDDIARAFERALADHRAEVRRAADERFAAHGAAVDRRLRGVEGRLAALASALTLSARQRHAPVCAAGRREERRGADGGGLGGAPEGGGVGGAAGADCLRPTGGGRLLALPNSKRK